MYSITCIDFKVTDELINVLRWDALLSEANSSNKRTEQSPYESDVQNLRFWMRKPEEVYKQIVQVKDLLREMSGQWFFNLRSTSRNQTNGGLQEGGWTGVTVAVGGPGKGSITPGAEFIRALLTKNLTV